MVEARSVIIFAAGVTIAVVFGDNDEQFEPFWPWFLDRMEEKRVM